MKEDQVMTSPFEDVLLPGMHREFLPTIYYIGHKCTGRNNLGGCPTQSPLFANIFAQLKTKICPNGADF